MKTIHVILLILIVLSSKAPLLHAQLDEYKRSIAELYHLNENESFKEITQEVLNNPYTTEQVKGQIVANHRKIYLFEYPSDGLKVKGFISLTPNYANQPLLVLLRGGNRLFGLLNPGIDLTTHKDFTVISTTYRGGVSEGEDEYGGADVNDVKNLMDFIPQIEEFLQIRLQPSRTYLLGQSRGGLQMFLALARFPELQGKFDKIISLSGLLDISKTIQARPDLREMFKEDFGMTEQNQMEWLSQRNPIQHVQAIKKDLPILILQGTLDERIPVEDGYTMVKKLEENGNQVTYWELEGGAHNLSNRQDRMELIADWLNLHEGGKDEQ